MQDDDVEQDEDGDEVDQQIDGDEMVEDQELNIEGGGQQIEEDGMPAEQDMMNQQFTQEQIEQMILLQQQAQ